MTFGLQCDELTSIEILDRAVDAGVTFLDTADVYPLGAGLDLAGRTEEIIGRWLRGRRDQFVLATKCFGRIGPRPFHRGNSRRNIFHAVEGSLRRLGTDYIDLYQLHAPDPETPIDETLEALDDLVRSGKLRYVGCSNFLAYQVALALGRSEIRGNARFASVQPRYNLLFREVERELFPLCLEQGLGVIPYNPLAGGLLSGKHSRRELPPEHTRFTLTAEVAETYRTRYWHEHSFDAVDSIAHIAIKAGIPMPTLAVAWVLSNPAVTSPIIGASHPDQVTTTIAAVDVKLDEATLGQLDAATRLFRQGDAKR